MTYTVKKGDTLSGIAHKHNTTVEALVASNGIKNKNVIFPGQVLHIPSYTPSKEMGKELRKAFNECLDAIEALPEFQTLSGLLEED